MANTGEDTFVTQGCISELGNDEDESDPPQELSAIINSLKLSNALRISEFLKKCCLLRSDVTASHFVTS